MNNEPDAPSKEQGGSGPPPEEADERGSAQPDADDLDKMWALVGERWDDGKAHDSFVQACFDRRRLDVAASRYKTAAGDAARAGVADKRLQSVVFLATQALQAERSEPHVAGRRWTYAAAALVCAASLAVLAYALTK